VYHSVYDNFEWMKKFGDPHFAYHAAAAQVAGLLALRLAEADVLPLDYAAYAVELDRYTSELETAARQAGRDLDLKDVAEALAEFRTVARQAMKQAASAAGDPSQMARLNRALREAEQALLSPEGLAGRPWFRHTVFAPGTYQGYGVVMLPGVREALERGDLKTARREAAALAAAMRRAAATLKGIE
jgi:N-acetylated-alpha-linked acidic dipeptidase